MLSRLQKNWDILKGSGIVKPERTIVLNQIRTPDGTILMSLHRHDYQTHVDNNGLTYMADGGTAYLRRNIHHDAPFTELTVYSDSPFEIIRESFYRGGRGKDGTEPLTWVPMAKMSDDWLEAVLVYNKERGVADHAFAQEMYRQELAYRKEKGISLVDATT